MPEPGFRKPATNPPAGPWARNGFPAVENAIALGCGTSVPDLKTIPCPVCGASDEQVCKDRVNQIYRIVKCRQCGLSFTNPMPLSGGHDAAGQVYDGWEYHDIFRKNPDRALEMARLEMRLQIQFWRGRRVLPAKPGRLLDLGCGAGRIPAAAQEAGWEAIGLEVDEKAFAYTAKLWNLDIRPVVLAEAGFPKNSFDWVRARYVLEHLADPAMILKEVLRVLKPGGIFTIDVPNQEGFFSRLRIIRGQGKGMGQVYGYLDPPLHVIGYSPRTMKRLLERCGFEVPYSFSVLPGSPVWRPECGHQGIKKWPYQAVQWGLSLLDLASISVTCGHKPQPAEAKA